MIIIIFILTALAIYVPYSVLIARIHLRDVTTKFKHRVHVNGIRGKSSVTRLIAATLREGGVKTLGKTTGTEARMFVSHRTDWPIERNEANILEQRHIMKKYIKSNYKAVVFECMAINPIYQTFLEEKIMRSTVGVITNVREDHVDVLGHTVREIAESLSSTIPQGSHFITAETDKEAVEVFKRVCKERNTVYHQAPVHAVSDKHIKKFLHYEYKENVAIALEVAKIAGIKKRTALSGMYKSLPDPGAFKLERYNIDGKKQKTIYWANLFAINDRESFVNTVSALRVKVGSRTKRAVILNNRHDRPERVAQFVDIVLNSFKVDYIITFGDYEKQVVRLVNKSRNKIKPKVVHLGNSSDYRGASGEVLWQEITKAINSKECLLIGAVNVHTLQAHKLIHTMNTSAETSYA